MKIAKTMLLVLAVFAIAVPAVAQGHEEVGPATETQMVAAPTTPDPTEASPSGGQRVEWNGPTSARVTLRVNSPEEPAVSPAELREAARSGGYAGGYAGARAGSRHIHSHSGGVRTVREVVYKTPPTPAVVQVQQSTPWGVYLLITLIAAAIVVAALLGRGGNYNSNYLWCGCGQPQGVTQHSGRRPRGSTTTVVQPPAPPRVYSTPTGTKGYLVLPNNP